MIYRPLGNSDLRISHLSFGCMSLVQDYSTNEKLLHSAMDKGINFFDTADLYQQGMNEMHVGKALKSKRGKIYIATKGGNEWRVDGKSWDWNPSKKYIIQAVEKSLQRLQTDYIDLYQLHGGTIDDPIDETIEAFEELISQGKIRYYGISSIRPNVIREYIKRSNIISVMIQYSMLDRRPEEYLFDLVHNAGKGVLVRGAFAKGYLLDKSPGDYLSYNKYEIASIQKELSENTHWSSPIQASLQYCLANPAISSIVAGIRTQIQLNELIKYGNEKLTISGLAIEGLKSISKECIYNQHR